ncbi:hypothetical protein CISG_01046 [Coccidioides immitis RMSCC 3703]|uniref:Zn(2)-C6 fungal-type domain-containing protein n=1 Tax=Coccidioides immitis RMSCC 3703 TaxID=454286 RepID=A0A0J8TRF5_COCIT|nr:hypothetical protein CISG_01046 [Coccidioides immitis RMSCC 3703]
MQIVDRSRVQLGGARRHSDFQFCTGLTDHSLTNNDWLLGYEFFNILVPLQRVLRQRFTELGVEVGQAENPFRNEIFATCGHMMEFREKETTQANERRQCWECSRRRLVCDSSRPACNKCQTAGITCPGYSQKKPLKWLPPGKVTSRTRRRRGRPTDKGDSNTSSSAPTTVNPSLGTSEVEESSIKSLTCHTENGMKDVAAALSHVTFGTEACAFTQAILYYNSCIYPHFESMHQLAPNPYLLRFSLSTARYIPTGMKYTLVSMALNHRIYHLLSRTSRSTLAEALSNLYHYRGLAIRALGEDVGKEKTRSSDATITSVLLFMVTDVRDSLSLNWRQHFIGAEKLISLRGGLENLARVSPHMKPMLLYYMILGVIGNTTTPPSDQVATTSQLDLANLASEMYGEGYLFPNLLCPPSLFLDILSINHLRYQWKIASLVNQFSQTAAEAVLQHVDASRLRNGPVQIPRLRKIGSLSGVYTNQQSPCIASHRCKAFLSSPSLRSSKPGELPTVIASSNFSRRPYSHQK